MALDAGLEATIEQVFKLHIKRAPGIVIGVVMVDLARRQLGIDPERVGAVCETRACLPDAIQVMTGCTLGNGYLRMCDEIGRYACTLYDRKTGDGVRVFVDVGRIDSAQTPELHRFFLRQRGPAIERSGPERTASNQRVADEFRTVGTAVLGTERVRVLDLAKPPLLPARICADCHESFLVAGEAATCRVCAGAQRYYEKTAAG